MEQKRKAKQKQRFDADEKDSDCILHGYLKKYSGSFASVWQTRYAKLYPNRLELHTESSSTKPDLVFMDQIEEIAPDYIQFKNEQCIQIKFRDGIRDGRLILTMADEIGLKEWSLSLRGAHKESQELLGSMAKKAGKIYGTERDASKANVLISSSTTSYSNASATTNAASGGQRNANGSSN